MASLRDLQLGFASVLRGGDAAPIAHCIVANGIDSGRRVGIYANNVRENFLATLEATFPTLLQLAGHDWLRQAGRRYLLEQPSRSGNLHFVGQRFAAWLATEVGDGPYAYFVDVARLEWAYQEVLVAAEPAALDFDALAAVPAERHAELVLQLSPAARLVASVYPVFAIWQAHRGAASEPATVHLDAGPSRVLLVRRSDHVELRELPPADFALLAAIAHRRPLGAALEAALEAAPDCDLAACLRDGLRAAVSGFQLPNPCTPTRSLP
jgi:hypothetical protein